MGIPGTPFLPKVLEKQSACQGDCGPFMERPSRHHPACWGAPPPGRRPLGENGLSQNQAHPVQLSALASSLLLLPQVRLGKKSWNRLIGPTHLLWLPRWGGVVPAGTLVSVLASATQTPPTIWPPTLLSLGSSAVKWAHANGAHICSLPAWKPPPASGKCLCCGPCPST